MTQPLTITEASERIIARSVAPLNLVESCLERISAVDDRIHSYIHVDADGARAAATEAAGELAAGHWRGPLHGIPFAVKDNYDAAGMPATANSRVRLDNVPRHDSELVRRLKAAGAILIGKLSTWEYGTGNGGDYADLPFPTARNPWDTERFPGGSSTGAGASVAAGTAMFAMGSDTTGSVRLPAAATGTVGIIPTPGRLSLEGILPNCWSLDNPGPFTWTIADCAIVLDAIAEKTHWDGPSALAFRRAVGKSAAGMRVAVVTDVGADMPEPDADLRSAFEAGLDVLRGLGVDLVETKLPVAPATCFAATSIIGPAESAAIHEQELSERPDELGFALRDKLLAGSMVRAVDYICAQRQRKLIADAIERFMSGFDALVTFGALHVSPRLGIEPEMTAFTMDTLLPPFSLSAHPALIQCNGYTDAGLPLHWQIVANRGDEASIFRLASAYEVTTPWRQRRPDL
ncbi:MAG: amidase [Alphaproteobacteria bacterium]|nr:amidase [Alphaproteobacteria bacterium]